MSDTSPASPPAVEREACILDGSSNRAVVQLSTRNYPGMVIQGDTLNNLRSLLQEALDNAGDNPPETLGEALEHIEGMLRHYEAVLKREGRDLPYFR